MEPNLNAEKRFALLIDADNVSAKYLQPILDELSNYGTVTYKRIYGDWTLASHVKWKKVLLENSITPIQQFGYTQGKNATDSAMIIDAMDILYAGGVEGFCIVSSDSDFTRLAVRLRESGLTVIGMGEKKTPIPFRKACDIFTTLELLLKDRTSRRDAGSGSSTSRAEIERAVVDIIVTNQNNGKGTGLGEVGSRLQKRYPDFDVRNYGTNVLSNLLGSFKSVRIVKDHNNVTVLLAEDADPSEEAAAAAAAEQPAEETPAEQEIASTAKPKRKRRSRRGKEEAAAAEAAVESAEPTEPAAEETPAAPEPAAAEETPAAASEADKLPAIQEKANGFILSKLTAVGDEGIPVVNLGRVVRNRVRDFKVRELGFQHFRGYLDSLGYVDIQKEDGIFVARLKE